MWPQPSTDLELPAFLLQLIAEHSKFGASLLEPLQLLALFRRAFLPQQAVLGLPLLFGISTWPQLSPDVLELPAYNLQPLSEHSKFGPSLLEPLQLLALVRRAFLSQKAVLGLPLLLWISLWPQLSADLLELPAFRLQPFLWVGAFLLWISVQLHLFPILSFQMLSLQAVDFLCLFCGLSGLGRGLLELPDSFPRLLGR